MSNDKDKGGCVMVPASLAIAGLGAIWFSIESGGQGENALLWILGLVLLGLAALFYLGSRWEGRA